MLNICNKEVFKILAYLLNLHSSDSNCLCFGESFYEFLSVCLSVLRSSCLVYYHVFMKILNKAQLTCSVQFSSVAQSCPTLCDPMNRSTPGLLVHHQLPEFTQTHIHRVSDAIQPTHPLPFPSPPATNHSQQQSLFQ